MYLINWGMDKMTKLDSPHEGHYTLIRISLKFLGPIGVQVMHWCRQLFPNLRSDLDILIWQKWSFEPFHSFGKRVPNQFSPFIFPDIKNNLNTWSLSITSISDRWHHNLAVVIPDDNERDSKCLTYLFVNSELLLTWKLVNVDLVPPVAAFTNMV